jgi:hypothetical protein
MTQEDAPAKPASWTGASCSLDRIMIYRKHSLVPINHVNPIYINDLEQIHMVVESPSANHLAWAKMAIPTNHDLL